MRIFGLGLCVSLAAAPAAAAPKVEAPAGAFAGTEVDAGGGGKVTAFLGIHYAESPSGERRWRAPVPKAKQAGVVDATHFGDVCPQGGHASGLKQSEDCLSLNIWAPAKPAAKPRAVMVYFHGGNFNSGGNGGDTFNMWDGASLAASGDVLVVSPNYRIGALGFLTTSELEGNYGLLDQIEALRWVQANIGAFGGDPAAVTIFGESAGAIAVGFHVAASPASAPLFRAAILESDLFAVPAKDLPRARALGTLFSAQLGAVDAATMRKKTVAELLAAQDATSATSQKVFTGLDTIKDWGPIVDGKTVTVQPIAAFAAGAVKKAIMIGTNAAEANLFVAQWGLADAGLSRFDYIAWVTRSFGGRASDVLATYPPADDAKENPRRLARLMTDYLATSATRQALDGAAKSASAVFAYWFEHAPSANFLCTSMCADAACHVAELPFVFRSLEQILLCPPEDKPGFKFTAAEATLAAVMQTYWTNFAKHLDPSGGATAKLEAWRAYSAAKPAYMHFGAKAAMGPAPEANDAFWRKIGFVLLSPWDPKP